MTIDNSPESLRRERQFREMELLDPQFRIHGLWDVMSGISCVLHGLLDLAPRFFRLAIPSFLAELGPAGPPEIEFQILPAASDEVETEVLEAMNGKVDVAGASAVIPFDARVKSEWWMSVAICRWFLDNQHDAESYRMASQEFHRYFQTHPKEVNDPEWADDQGRTFCAAGDDQRVIEYFTRQANRFKPPAGPRHVRSERAMAWMLATHRIRGEWKQEELEQGWKQFLAARTPALVEHGPHLSLAIWLKMRFWDGVDPKPDPYDTFMRVYDILSIPRPLVVKWENQRCQDDF